MRSVILVYGPPCAGKTTWVRAHASPGDTIVDWDQLAVNAGSPVTHDHPPYFAAAASRERKRLEARIAHTDRGVAFVIRTLPNPRDVDDLVERLRVTTVKRVDPGEGVCMERARAANRPVEVLQAIHNWYVTQNGWKR